jgi:hypothetical protein
VPGAGVVAGVVAGGTGFSYSVRPSYGLYVALLAGIVETAAALLALRTAGEQRPWDEPAPEKPDAPTTLE